MKKNVKLMISLILLLIITIWVIDKIPFSKTVEHSISANIYQNGVFADETTITMHGEKTNYLFRKNDSFVGWFAVPSAEKTIDEDMQISINWSGEKDEKARHIRFFKAGTIYSAEKLGVVPYMLINDSMTKFALMLTDGTIIATSDELHEIYITHFTWNEDTGTTTITGANIIPETD